MLLAGVSVTANENIYFFTICRIVPTGLELMLPLLVQKTALGLRSRLPDEWCKEPILSRGPLVIPGSVRNARKARCVPRLRASLPASNDVIWIAWHSLVIPPTGSRTVKLSDRSKQPGPGAKLPGASVRRYSPSAEGGQQRSLHRDVVQLKFKYQNPVRKAYMRC